MINQEKERLESVLKSKTIELN